MAASATLIGKLLYPFSGLSAEGTLVNLRSGTAFGSNVAAYPKFERTYKIDADGWIDSAAGVKLATDDDADVTYTLEIPGQSPIEFDVSAGITYHLGELMYGGVAPDTLILTLGVNLKEAVGDVAWSKDGVLVVEYVEKFANASDGVYLAARRTYKLSDPSIEIVDSIVPNGALPVPNTYKAHMRFSLPDHDGSSYDAYIQIDTPGEIVHLQDIINGDYSTP